MLALILLSSAFLALSTVASSVLSSREDEDEEADEAASSIARQCGEEELLLRLRLLPERIGRGNNLLAVVGKEKCWGAGARDASAAAAP